MNDHKIINDPVFGFIKIPRGVLLNIVKHPLMQRLSRIKQLGLASVVYPGAQHTRFQHSLGAFHLMSEAIMTLSQKGVFIFDSEAEAVQAAILMHDIGHGPFSHVLENTLINGITHEEISIMMMEEINAEMQGKLNLALNIFKNEYPKQFLHQLISSQLDMDRLDYLRRDCFFTGVVEGNIGSARIIKMLNVVDDQLVVESKGIYSIENFLTSRRLMYWQVYLHKTAVAYEKILVNLLSRAKFLAKQGKDIFAPPHLKYFLYNHVDATHFYHQREALRNYELLDDNDIWCSIKVWASNEDKILSLLAQDLLNRNIFHVEVREEPISDEEIRKINQSLAREFGISEEDAQFLMSVNTIQKDMYDIEDENISILTKNGEIKDFAEASEILNIASLSKKNRKYYLCYQRI
ncbi:MAG: HD domain-containing protein [Prevotella sp.]|nr:HD domain-containing protein [Prevotella sp.]MBQ1667331.1 HD domain-containing protein [Prevotella sp.]MBQ2215367.1 HD domain-containing protein [Prevotella sp.]MBQ2345185.1 HD domain-containing protein [Prevotella sp.]MBQ2496723.1 HD domain-containing protein [Prevotella sp.]